MNEAQLARKRLQLKEKKLVTMHLASRRCLGDTNKGNTMDWDDYLREQAALYRQLAEKAEDAFVKQELLDLAVVCEEVANNIEDRLASG
jgi:hypothetical protein